MSNVNVGGIVTGDCLDATIAALPIHPAAIVTNNATPFAWNAATQTLNVPQAPTLVANGDGSHTFTAGDGSAPVVIPADCCPTLVDNGNGTYTFTNGSGGTITFATSSHPAAALTNNAAPFAWNGATQTGNIPQSPVLALTATGFTFTPGNGSAAVNYVEPVDEDTYVTGFSIAGNTATITLNNGTTFTQTIPTTVDINVQSFALSGTDLILTETDGTVHTVPLPQEIKVSAVGYVAATGILTVTNSDGTSVATTIPTHPAAIVTNNAAPFAWDAATQTLNVPQAPSLVANGDGSYTFTAGDGSAPVTIPSSLLSGLNGLLNGLTTTQQVADVIDDWTKQVVNSGATLPIANVADAGAQPLLTGGQLQIGETDEIIPTIGADGVLRMTERIVYGHSTIPSAQLLPPTTFTQINYSQVIEDTHGAIQADGSWIVPVDGIYEICAGWQDLARDKTTFQETEVSIQVFVNGTFTRRIGYGNFGPYSDASVNPGPFGCGLFRLTRGQVVTLRGNNTATIPLNTPMQADANPIVTYMNFLKVK